tara:strand:- start:72 stop:323 length:252 start_codon:yes stop_codon:yes gene_type:complete
VLYIGRKARHGDKLWIYVEGIGMGMVRKRKSANPTCTTTNRNVDEHPALGLNIAGQNTLLPENPQHRGGRGGVEVQREERGER